MNVNSLKYNRIFAVVLAAVLVAVSCCSIVTVPIFGATSVMVGQASKGESGSYNQTAGDQTGKEVYVSAWNHNSTTRHWSLVARANDTKVRAKIAQTVMDACNNEHVGYDRADGDIKSFYLALQAAGWDASKIAVDCETTCTPLIAAAINAAGIKCDAVISAAKFKSLFTTGALSNYFKVYTSSDYTASSSKLVAGDILITYYTTGDKTYSHGAVVVSSPNAASGNASNRSAFKPSGVSNIGCVVGKSYVTTTELNVRYGPATTYSIKKRADLSSDGKKNALDGTYAVLKSGTTVTCIAVHGNWIEIPSGWICGYSNGQAHLSGVAPVLTAASSTAKTASTKTVKTTTKSSTTVTVKKGKNYKLKKTLYVRKGPGTNYAAKKRSSLSASAKKYAVKNIKSAKFKKGTVVTCLEKKGNWMRIPSGWVCCKKGNVANA